VWHNLREPADECWELRELRKGVPDGCELCERHLRVPEWADDLRQYVRGSSEKRAELWQLRDALRGRRAVLWGRL
jgi:hypothetical protein